ncbi:MULTISPECIES: hypothetical protein [Pontibacillus]|uniref:Beta-lactamase superfamily II metal-dependent hydrolase n=1 Tax=Pontibacillus chungwhensis TaxID=265426 RepID=A0ABY8UTI6_9BACI|nr:MULTISPECIES: hypothetical protein [Pontibacillus]MCD5322963.1 hypothetical protein [Pontibacillus sp. HN14]WIF96357.1 hypothetical protein QNI29_11395 [Pontibacillus chungwhensis]
MRRLLIMFFVIFSIHGQQVDAERMILDKNEAIFVFLSLPDGEAMLIQTGRGKDFLVNTASKASEEKLLEQLANIGVDQLDSIILTNQEPSTCGNTSRIVERYHVDAVIHGMSEKKLCAESSNHAKEVIWKEGELHELNPGLSVRVLPSIDGSDMSLFFMYGKTSLMYLASGDMELEQKIANSYPLKAEVIKIADYARTQSPTLHFLEEVDPHVAMVYPLKGARPNEGLLERLHESWIEVYQLKKTGTTTIFCNLEDYEVLS